MREAPPSNKMLQTPEIVPKGKLPGCYLLLCSCGTLVEVPAGSSAPCRQCGRRQSWPPRQKPALEP